MKRFIKYGVVPVVIFLFLLGFTVIVLPVVINVQKFIPEIEEKLSDVTGRSISIGSNLGLSFFPWLSISFSDLKIENPHGYLSDGFIKIESFEARVKLLPLLKKELEISRCIIGGLEVNLEKRYDGKENWDFTQENSAEKTIITPSSPMANLFSPEDLSFGLFVITDGTVTWVDKTQDSRLKIDDLMLILSNDASQDSVAVEFKAAIGGKSLDVEGSLGTFGKAPGMGELPVNLAVNINNILSGQVEGQIINLVENPSYDLDLHISPFSIRELFVSLDIDFPFITADPATFLSVGVDVTAKGDKEKVSIEKGKIHLDDTLIDILLVVKELESPDLGFAMDIDHLNLDRYLPPAAAAEEERNAQDSPIQSDQEMKNYEALRKVKLAGTIKIKELGVGGGTVNDINVNLRATDGIFAVDPSFFVFYQGRAETTLTADFKGDIPKTSIELKAHGVQALPLLHDFMAEDIMSGTVDTDVRLLFSGNSIDAIKKSLYADGTLIVKDGALEGIDMFSGIKNIPDSSAGSDTSIQNNRTVFSEIKSIFTIRNGLIDSRETTLDSPLASLLVSGTADLVSKELRLMIEPKIAAEMTGEQTNENDFAKGAIPFTVSGSFAKPKIDIDAQYLSFNKSNLSDELEMQNLVDEKLPSPVDEDVQNLVGRTLIDPVVVAQRFSLEPEVITKSGEKRQLTLGTGRVKIRPLQEEDAWH